MKLRKVLRVQIRIPGSKRRGKHTLTKAILNECRAESIHGATVVQCIFGYGEHEYTQRSLRGLTDLPQIIEIIDEPHAIMELLPKLKKIVENDGLITVEEVFAV